MKEMALGYLIIGYDRTLGLIGYIYIGKAKMASNKSPCERYEQELWNIF